ncbi:hypothetical protein ACFQ6N_25185 [Kitasatospora sp. NPDC056446]|uniref:hypothetical protein n=1 Tax=Kitasatospora sp. NPDC056446 TaxID=3345819 RepID=UPI00367DE272
MWVAHLDADADLGAGGGADPGAVVGEDRGGGAGGGEGAGGGAEQARAEGTRPARTTVRRWLPAVAAVLAAAAVPPLLLLPGHGSEGTGGAAAPPPTTAVPAKPSAAAPGEPPAVAPELPLFSPADGARTEIGGNHRCGRIRYVDGLAWTPCTRVDESGLSFAVRLTNTGPEAVTVQARVGWVRSGGSRACPGLWGTGVRVTLAPGQSLLSPPEQCVHPLLPATAFQARAEVGAPDAVTLYREMSVTAHIQPDRRVIWADEA